MGGGGEDGPPGGSLHVLVNSKQFVSIWANIRIGAPDQSKAQAAQCLTTTDSC